MMKPVIAIVAHLDKNISGMDAHSVTTTYTEAVEKAGGIPYILPLTRRLDLMGEMTAMARGFLFTGGMDVVPDFYGETPIPEMGRSSRDLDRFQMAAFEMAAAAARPVIAICRGIQLVNVALGGTLYQDIPAQIPESRLRHMQENVHYGVDHSVDIAPGSRLHELFGDRVMVNSRHHQSIKTPGRGLIVTASAPDGVIEGAQHETLPIDLIQWHPEMMLRESDAMLPLFTAFVASCAPARR
jgi:putative glutamine amidotransferase